MSIIVLSDVVLPEDVIRAGVSGRNSRNNLRTMTANGFGAINVNWTKTLRQYEIGIAPMHLDVWASIEGLHEVTSGGALGFLMLDPKDSNVTLSQGQLYSYLNDTLVGTSGFGYGLPTYKLFKNYTTIGGVATKRRQITRPKIGSLVIKRSGATVTPAVDYNTGTVTFTADVTQGISTHTVGASHKLTFPNSTGVLAQLVVGQRVYLNGITGTAASLLNAKSHIISAVDLVAHTMTLSVNTTGLTATSGTAYKYPQESESLVWSGVFYVPVHFLDDSIEWEILRPGTDAQRLIAGVSVVLQEIRE